MSRGTLMVVLALAALAAVLSLVWVLHGSTPLGDASEHDQSAGNADQLAGVSGDAKGEIPGDVTLDAMSSESQPGATSHPVGEPAARMQEQPPTTHLSGVASDGQENPLARHIVEVERPEGGVEGRVVTGSDGTFRIDGLEVGKKVVRLLGPGKGDVLAGCLAQQVGDCGQQLIREERRLDNVVLPESGLERVSLVVPFHAARLIRLRVVDDLERPLGTSWFTLGNSPEVHSDEHGIICEPVIVTGDKVVSLNMIGRVFDSEDASKRFLPIELALQVAPAFQDLGTFVMPRAAGLALTLIDATNGVGIGDAVIRLSCTGGGQPPAEVLGEMDDVGTYMLWSGRAAGEYALEVSATGYQPARRVGELVVGDEPQRLELVLERVR